MLLARFLCLRLSRAWTVQAWAELGNHVVFASAGRGCHRTSRSTSPTQKYPNVWNRNMSRRGPGGQRRGHGIDAAVEITYRDPGLSTWSTSSPSLRRPGGQGCQFACPRNSSDALVSTDMDHQTVGQGKPLSCISQRLGRTTHYY
ncbi:hypothetical protein B0J13DRAFT_153746 [Dactylonectria estremocensis]|uniref:Secreted protein n=1 Tax=Dactylonectria estremocensis TaxID=1079267 RepID=A0A9P9IKA2_9HYPO|nr:hypothetical protein B0J13DRAFT_153746 [Dactylonectria estremocensis]